MLAWPSASVRKWSRRVAYPREDGVESERELFLEDARSIREGMWRIAHLVQDAAELLDARIEEEDLWMAWRRPWRCARPWNAYRL